MARIIVTQQGMGSMQAYHATVRRRLNTLPRRRSLETSARLAVIHDRGGRQVVVSRGQRGAIFAKVGPGVSIPAVGSVMIHPRRPVRVTPKMARAVVVDDALHVLTGSPSLSEPLMRTGVTAQFSVGGVPPWAPSRDWGRLRARRPTLGGPGGRVAAGWRAARYVRR